MKLKFRLSIIVIAIMAVVVTVIAVVLLNTSSSTAIGLNVQLISEIGEARKEYWSGRENERLQLLRTIADTMSGYESIPAADRRDQFETIMEDVLDRNTNFITIYTVWKPNAIDGMDSRYIGRNGSTPTGQFAIAYTRENGPITSRMTTDVDASMEYLNGPNSKKERVLTPVMRTVSGKSIYVLRFMVPVINPRTNETVGGVGGYIDITNMQVALEETIKSNPIIAAMSIYDNTGFILSSYVPDRVGKNLRDVDAIYGDHINEAFQAVQKGESANFDSYSDVLKSNVSIDLTPFVVGNSDVTWIVMIAAIEESAWFSRLFRSLQR